jgi:hypothetical protein
MVELPFGLEAGANFFGRQGFPVVYFVRTATNDTRGSVLGIQIGPTTAYRLSPVFQLDLHLEKAIRIGSAVTIRPILDCFNVVNSQTVLERDGLVGSYDANRATPFRQNGSFDQPSELLSSRVLRGGLRISF